MNDIPVIGFLLQRQAGLASLDVYSRSEITLAKPAALVTASLMSVAVGTPATMAGCAGYRVALRAALGPLLSSIPGHRASRSSSLVAA